MKYFNLKWKIKFKQNQNTADGIELQSVGHINNSKQCLKYHFHFIDFLFFFLPFLLLQRQCNHWFFFFFFIFHFQSFADMYRSNVVNVLSSIKVYPSTFFPHYLHPNTTLFLNGTDDADDDGEEETFTPTFGIRSTYPIKLPLPTDINSIVQQNIVLRLVQQKNDFINDAEKLIGNHKRSSQ